MVDRLAAMQHDATGGWATNNTSDMLPQTNSQLHLPQGRYTGRVNENIQYALRQESADEYILRKLQLRNKKLVDWDLLGRHHRWLSWQRRATRLKMIFWWAPTNARNHIIGTLDTPMCPLCGNHHKTMAHVLRCPSSSATKARADALTELEQSLDDMGTHPDLISIIGLAVTLGVEPPCNVLESDINIRTILKDQGNIGWHLLQYGFVAKEWKAEQCRWKMTQDPNYSPKKGVRWARQLQESL